MKKNIKLIAISVFLGLLPIVLSSCQNNNQSHNEDNPVVEDNLYFTPEYEYKIVKCNSVVTVPSLNINRLEVKSVTYTFNGNIVVDQFTAPSEVGLYTMTIYVVDNMYDSYSSDVIYRVTDNDNDLNIIYDLSTKEGLESHLGKSRIGVNGQRITLYKNGVRTYTNPYGEVVTERATDINGDVIPSFTNDVTSQTINDFIVSENQILYTRLVFSNVLNTRWDLKYSQVYFYFFNGAGTTLTLNFNGYALAVNGSGWNKIIIAPKTMPNGQVVTDYEVISSNGQNVTHTGMIDLEDCVGTFLKVDFSNSIYYGKYAISSIWGNPLEA